MSAQKTSQKNVISKILHGASRLFLSVGYSKASIIKIAEESGVNRGSVCFFFKDKESIVCELVSYVLEFQFEEINRLLEGKTEDKILIYAAETTLQLHLAESSEHMREMYNVAYSMSQSSNVIYHIITKKLEEIFRETLPDWKTKNFYVREISSAGIMRNQMSVPCDIYYTMERKVREFLEATLLVYRVPEAKIQEAITFVGQFDWKQIAESVLTRMPAYLESKT